MEELFNLANFDSYKEDNRREVKKAFWDTLIKGSDRGNHGYGSA